MKNILTKGLENSTPYIVLDCSIEDLEQRKKQALRFDSATKAGNYLGMAPHTVASYASKQSILNQRRFLSKKFNKHFAIRADAIVNGVKF